MVKCLVQIYEVQTPDEAEQLVAAGVDHIGSVLLPDADPRQPLIRSVVMETRQGNAKSSMIPLFQDSDRVSRALDYYQPDIVHFCESLGTHHRDPDGWRQAYSLQHKIRDRFPQMRIMRSIPIAPPGNGATVSSLALARLFEDISDYFLTDTFLVTDRDDADVDQPVAGYVGITGRICDWQTAARLVDQSSIPVILAGGISPDNVVEGIDQVKPAGVDSCTGTNAVDGAGQPIRFRKDLQRVRELVEKVRCWDTQRSL